MRSARHERRTRRSSPMIEERFRAFGPMPEANRRQAMIDPVRRGGAETRSARRRAGGSTGDGSVTALMPGVPSEMRQMWTEQVRPRLAARFALAPVAIRSVKAFGIGESATGRTAWGDRSTRPPEGVDDRDLRAGRWRPRAVLDAPAIRQHSMRCVERDGRDALGDNVLRDRRRRPGLGRARSPR